MYRKKYPWPLAIATATVIAANASVGWAQETEVDPNSEAPFQVGELVDKVQDNVSIKNTPFTHLIEIEGHEGIAAISENGRFIFRGRIFDTWEGNVYSTVDEVRNAMENFDISSLGYTPDQLQPFLLGNGNETAMLFVDPLCPYCHQLFQRLAANPAYLEDYTFEVYAVPFLGEQSVNAVTAISCHPDRDAALTALTTGDQRWFRTVKEEVVDCNFDPIVARTNLAMQLGATGTPFIVAPGGGSTAGLPADLASFLSYN